MAKRTLTGESHLRSRVGGIGGGAMIDGIVTIREGKALVWNRPKGVTQDEMARLVSVLSKVTEAHGLPPCEPGLVVRIPAPAGSLYEILTARKIRTYDLVEEACDLV